MKKWQKIALITAVAAFVLLAMILLAMGVFTVLKIPPAERCYRIFESISELEMLEDYVIEDCEDPYLDDAVPVEHYCKMISYEGEEYLVAGYTFDTLLDTLRFYQCNIWNKRLNPEIQNGTLDPSFWNEGFRSETSIGQKTKLAYYYENNALLIESRTASSAQLEAFQCWLAESFTIEMPMADLMAEIYEQPEPDENTSEEASA